MFPQGSVIPYSYFYLPGTEHSAFNVMKTQEIFVELKKKRNLSMRHILVGWPWATHLTSCTSVLIFFFFLICKMMIFELHGLLNSAKF